MPEPRLLVVDDDQELAELLVLRLTRSGYRAEVAHGVKSALEQLERQSFDSVLLDLRLADGDGFAVLEGIRKRSPDLPAIILTAHGSIDTAVEAMRRGAFGFITKPFHEQDLLQQIAHSVESRRLRSEVAGLRQIVGAQDSGPQMVGVSPAIEQVRELVARVGPSDATVLILGESGTGKELVARSLHAASARASRAFVAINCAALAPDLLESTLFGHTRGAFTGAVANREGLFDTAEGGTLFLDEVGETPPTVQAKLLRVLNDHRFTPVGSTAERSADVRIIAASNRDLRHEVLERRFREDLFYRLHVVPVTVPPLRERGEKDILLLAELFLERAAGRHSRPVPRLGPAALAALAAHPWPGNVRELVNVMEAAALLSPGTEVGVEHLPGVGLEAGGGSKGAADDFGRAAERLLLPYVQEDTAIPSLREARDAIERAYLDTVLSRTQGNVSIAAKLAGRNRTDFYDLLRRHGRTASSFKRNAQG